MATKRASASEEIYQLKITLLGAEPPIWRRLLVPAGFTLERLHYVLQVAMGWADGHLHEFFIDQERYGTPDLADSAGFDPVSSERKAKLSKVLGTGSKALYTYDFGDGWEHTIVLEKVLPMDPGHPYPFCTGGERRCPPEDCGGIPGFYNLLEAIGDPKHEEYEEMRDWVGEDFDPEAFSVEVVNSGLKSLSR